MAFRLEQAIYTKSNRGLFTGLAGYAITAVSEGINEELAKEYILPVSASIQQSKIGDRLYMILPSTDGKLAVTHSVMLREREKGLLPVSSGDRECPFVHTYLMDQESAKYILQKTMKYAFAPRFREFRTEYIGTTVKLDTLEHIPASDEDVRDIDFRDIGFTRDSFAQFLRTVFLLHEAGDKSLNAFQRIFIVYEAPDEFFWDFAIKTLTLLYASLPYIITSKLGALVKTDSRFNESFPAGYSSAYWNRQGIAPRFIPGVGLYFLREPVQKLDGVSMVIRLTDNSVEFGKDIPRLSNRQEVLVQFILNALDHTFAQPESFDALHRFYAFYDDMFDRRVTIDDFSRIYSLYYSLEHPEVLESYDRENQHAQLLLLNLCLKQPGTSYESIINRARAFCLKLCEESEKAVNETFSALLAETGAVVFREDLRQFAEPLLCSLYNAGLINEGAERLRKELYANVELLKEMISLDSRFVLMPFCLSELRYGTLKNAVELLEIWEKYCVREEAVSELYILAKRSNAREAEEFLKSNINIRPVLAGLVKSMAAAALLNLYEGAKAEEFIKSKGKGLEALYQKLGIKDLWSAKLRLYSLTRTELTNSRHYADLKWLGEKYERSLLEHEKSLNGPQILNYREFKDFLMLKNPCSEQGNICAWELFKRHDTAKNWLSVRWDDIFSGTCKRGTIVDALYEFAAMLGEAEKYGLTAMSSGEFLSLYNCLRRELMRAVTVSKDKVSKICEALRIFAMASPMFKALFAPLLSCIEYDTMVSAYETVGGTKDTEGGSDSDSDTERTEARERSIHILGTPEEYILCKKCGIISKINDGKRRCCCCKKKLNVDERPLKYHFLCMDYDLFMLSYMNKEQKGFFSGLTSKYESPRLETVNEYTRDSAEVTFAVFESGNTRLPELISDIKLYNSAYVIMNRMNRDVDKYALCTLKNPFFLLNISDKYTIPQIEVQPLHKPSMIINLADKADFEMYTYDLILSGGNLEADNK